MKTLTPNPYPLHAKRYPLHANQNGYMMLLAVIAFGVVAIGVAVSAMMLGLKSTQTSFAKEKYHQARANANACAEDAIIKLRADLGAANFTDTLVEGTCSVTFNVPNPGSENLNRVILSTGIAENATWRVQVSISKVLPGTIITSWQEI